MASGEKFLVRGVGQRNHGGPSWNVFFNIIPPFHLLLEIHGCSARSLPDGIRQSRGLHGRSVDILSALPL